MDRNFGTCKLTGKRGRFVKAHIIPKALTYPAERGLPFYQYGPDNRAVRRWSSWYDPALVTAEGETILRDLDTWAIDILRREKLVWSGWGAMLSLPVQSILHPAWGIRSVNIPERSRLRLFFLSLLWRGAATSLPEFREVDMPPPDLELLRAALVEGRVPEQGFYPATLTQLSTIGVVHNHGAIAQEKIIPSVDGRPSHQIPIFRFYFDGLVVHFHRQASDLGETHELGPMVVGNEDQLTVSTVTFEQSFQLENLVNMSAGAFHVHR